MLKEQEFLLFIRVFPFLSLYTLCSITSAPSVFIYVSLGRSRTVNKHRVRRIWVLLGQQPHSKPDPLKMSINYVSMLAWFNNAGVDFSYPCSLLRYKRGYLCHKYHWFPCEYTISPICPQFYLTSWLEDEVCLLFVSPIRLCRGVVWYIFGSRRFLFEITAGCNDIYIFLHLHSDHVSLQLAGHTNCWNL
jgi:hypothetical protein